MCLWNKLFTHRMFFRVSPGGFSGAKDLYKWQQWIVCEIVPSGAQAIFFRHLLPSNDKKFQVTGITWR